MWAEELSSLYWLKVYLQISCSARAAANQRVRLAPPGAHPGDELVDQQQQVSAPVAAGDYEDFAGSASARPNHDGRLPNRLFEEIEVIGAVAGICELLKLMPVRNAFGLDLTHIFRLIAGPPHP
jgi:hypothetical protein